MSRPSTESRLTDAPGGFTHQALLYGCVNEFLAGTLPVVRDGLACGDGVLVATTDANTVALRAALSGCVDAVDFVNPHAWYDSPGRTLARCRDYLDRRSTPAHRVRIIAEPVWAGRTSQAVREWKRCEAAINVALADTNAWILCPYNTRFLNPDITTAAWRTHPELVNGATRTSPSYTDPATYLRDNDGLEPEFPWDDPSVPAPESAERWHFTRAVIAEVRRSVSDAARRTGLAGDRLGGLVYAVNEVVTNAVVHGAGYGTVSLWSSGRALVCDVTDSAGGPIDAHAGQSPPDEWASSGRGLWLARQLCDRLTIHTSDEGTLVRLQARLP